MAASITTGPPDPQTTCALLSLPPELRLLIWESALDYHAAPREIPLSTASKLGPNLSLPLTYHIVYNETKTIHKEASEAFWRTNTVTVHSNLDWERNMAGLRSIHIQHIQTILISSTDRDLDGLPLAIKNCTDEDDLFWTVHPPEKMEPKRAAKMLWRLRSTRLKAKEEGAVWSKQSRTSRMRQLRTRELELEWKQRRAAEGVEAGEVRGCHGSGERRKRYHFLSIDRAGFVGMGWIRGGVIWRSFCGQSVARIWVIGSWRWRSRRGSWMFIFLVLMVCVGAM